MGAGNPTISRETETQVPAACQPQPRQPHTDYNPCVFCFTTAKTGEKYQLTLGLRITETKERDWKFGDLKNTRLDFLGGLDGKASCLQCGRHGFYPRIRKNLWRRKRQPTPVLLPGKSHGRRSMVCYSPWGSQSQTRLSNFTSLQKAYLLLSSVFLLPFKSKSPVLAHLLILKTNQIFRCFWEIWLFGNWINNFK